MAKAARSKAAPAAKKGPVAAKAAPAAKKGPVAVARKAAPAPKKVAATPAPKVGWGFVFFCYSCCCAVFLLEGPNGASFRYRKYL